MAHQQPRAGATVARMEARGNALPAWSDVRSPDAPREVEVVPFTVESLRMVRDHVGALGDRAGLAADPLADLVLAVHEIASNSIRHGGGRGELRAWLAGGWIVCEVRDAGWIRVLASVGRRPTSTGAAGGRGLWMAEQLCDRMQIRSTPAGTVVRLQQRVR